jgi:hypothetical protein
MATEVVKCPRCGQDVSIIKGKVGMHTKPVPEYPGQWNPPQVVCK